MHPETSCRSSAKLSSGPQGASLLCSEELSVAVLFHHVSASKKYIYIYSKYKLDGLRYAHCRGIGFCIMGCIALRLRPVYIGVHDLEGKPLLQYGRVRIQS